MPGGAGLTGAKARNIVLTALILIGFTALLLAFLGAIMLACQLLAGAVRLLIPPGG